MARKKKKSKRRFGFASPPKRKRTKRQAQESRAKTVAFLKKIAVALAVIVAVGAVALGFTCLKRYVHAVSPVSTDTKELELISPPVWVGHQLDGKITDAVGDYHNAIETNPAKTVASRLQNLAWLYNVKVQTTGGTIQISARYRKPVAMVKSGGKKYYLSLVKSDDLRYEEGKKRVVVLDYIEITNIPIVEIKGFAPRSIPPAGSVWESQDITTTVELLNVLARMDNLSCKDNPLLEEFASIDVSNFGGRRDKDDPHVVLYAKDMTPVYWGAAYGMSTLFLEATEQEKLGKLYTFYKDHNSSLQCLTNNVCRSVELRYAKDYYPRPAE